MAQLREGSVIKKVGGDEVIATVNDIPEIPTSLPANGGNADTIGGFTVGADVPSNAKFTDTVTTINGKTGAISKADIVTLGIPAQDTVYEHPTTHSADMIVDGSTNKAFTATEKTKLAGIATGANNYTHPANHPPSIITQDANNRFVTDTEKVAWSGKADKTYVDNKVKTDVPLNAKFTDTIVDISGKQDKLTAGDNIIITNNTISATDTVYTHPGSGTNPHGTTKSDVGLGNVTNDKQMPISGGVLENYREKLDTILEIVGLIDLSLGNVFQHSPSGDRTYSIINAVSGQAHSFTLIINIGSTVRTLTFPASVKWQGGEIPDMSTANKTYVLTFVSVDGGTNWLGMFGGEF